MNEKGDSGKASPREPRTFIQTRKNKKVTKLSRKKSDTTTKKNSGQAELCSSSPSSVQSVKTSEHSGAEPSSDGPHANDLPKREENSNLENNEELRVGIIRN